MTNTNAIGTPSNPLRLSDYPDFLQDRKRIPVGFFVSPKLWEMMATRLKPDSSGAPTTLVGAKVAIDPSLPDTQFDVAFTEEAWSKKLATLPSQKLQAGEQ